MDDTRWLNAEEHDAWVRFSAVLELLPGILDAQLGRDEGLTYFEYMALAMLSEAPGRTLRMTGLARRTNATLPRLSRVISRLEADGLVARLACPEDGRATNVTLTDAGWSKVVNAAPRHVETVRSAVFDQLDAAQVRQLSAISAELLRHFDPEGNLAATQVDSGARV